MQIVIVGAGTVGFELAVHLQNSGHDIAVVEADGERCAEIGEKLDLLVVEGPGSSPRALEQAGIEGAEMVLAVTSVDEVNILVCGMARQYGVETRIARIRSGEFRGKSAHVSLAELGVTRVIDPEQVMVRVIDQIARIPDAVEVFSYHEGKILIARHVMREGMPILDKRLVEVVQMAGEHQFLAVALRREEVGKTWIPAGDDVLAAGDDITTTFTRDSLNRYLEMLGLEGKRPRKTIVAGDGLTAVQLAQAFATWMEDVTLIDPSPPHAHFAAARLDGVEVIVGDPTERDVLHEVGVGRADLYVGAGKATSRNVMGALLARAEGAGRVIAMSLEPQSNELFRKIGVDHVISPRRAIAQEIMDVIARGHYSVELHLRNLDLEAVELRAGENSKVTRGPLQKVWTPYKRQAIVGAVHRDGQAIIPRGNTEVQPGDEVIVIIKPKHVHSIRGLFKGRKA